MAESTGTTFGDVFHWADENKDNVVASTLVLPDNGWITGINLYSVRGYEETTYGRLCIWNNNSGLRFASPQQTWTAVRAGREAAVPGLRMAGGDIFLFGFWRHPKHKAEWALTRNGKNHGVQTHLSPLSPPDPFNFYVSYEHAITGHVHWVRNEKPLKGAWRGPTPSGQTAQADPVFSGTLPHAGDGTVAVQSAHVSIRNGEAHVEVHAGDEHKHIAFAREGDVEAEVGPGYVYARAGGSSASVRSRSVSVARATQSVRVAGDSGFDYSARVQVTIRRVSDNAKVYEGGFEPTAQENAQGYFVRTFGANLVAGVQYYAVFRHQDSWGLWADVSSATTFVVNPGPDLTAGSPSGRITSTSGYVYRATHTHPAGLSVDAVHAEVFDETGAVKLYDSGVKALAAAVAPGGTISLSSAFHAALVPGRKHQWRMRARDTSGGWGPWLAPKVPFYANRKPYAPGALSPSGGRATAATTLKCSVGDPDGDGITAAQVDLYNATSGAKVWAAPKAMAISADGKTATYDAAADMVLGTLYKFQARASDGTVFGDWSGFAQFLYAQVPTVTLRSPKEGGFVNLVAQPSAEYDPAAVSSFWTEIGRDATSRIDRVADGDAAFGTVSWRATTPGNPNHVFQSGFMPVDATKHFFFAGELKTFSGNPASTLRLACFDAAGTRLGEVVPSSVRQLSAAAPETFWERYGGEVWFAGATAAHRFPAGTTRVNVEWLPSATAGAAGVVGLDAVFFAQADTKDGAEWLKVQPLYGFFDGDTQSFGPADDRTWDGAVGNSPSRGPAVLTAPSTHVEIAYSSSSAGATATKSDDRILVERWSGTAWQKVYETQYAGVGGARTTIPIPTSHVRNEGRYRATVWCRDSNSPSLEGQSGTVEFDVIYDGPPELPIVQIAGNPDDATIVATHQKTTLDPLEFAGLEIQVVGPDGTVVTHYDTNPDSDAFVVHFPESGAEYTIRLRQVRIVGNEQVESRWTEAKASVDYFPVFFLKSASDPARLNVAFYVMSNKLPDYKPVRDVKPYRTWESKKPKHAVGKARYDEGSVTVTLFDAPEFGRSAEQKLAMIAAMEEEMGALCLLGHKPASKRFVMLADGPSHGLSDAHDYEIDVGYRETVWEEDAIERGESLG